MPSLLYLLRVDDHSPEAAADTTAAAAASSSTASGAAAAMGGGMDWESVTVWSCEASCEGGNGEEEFVYVQNVQKKKQNRGGGKAGGGV